MNWLVSIWEQHWLWVNHSAKTILHHHHECLAFWRVEGQIYFFLIQIGSKILHLGANRKFLKILSFVSFVSKCLNALKTYRKSLWVDSENKEYAFLGPKWVEKNLFWEKQNFLRYSLPLLFLFTMSPHAKKLQRSPSSWFQVQCQLYFGSKFTYSILEPRVFFLSITYFQFYLLTASHPCAKFHKMS